MVKWTAASASGSAASFIFARRAAASKAGATGVAVVEVYKVE
jgi:hypothetical protein